MQAKGISREVEPSSRSSQSSPPNLSLASSSSSASASHALAADRLFVGNALDWDPSRRFTFIRTGLEYVPRHRRRELVEHLLGLCERLIIGVFNEEAHARPTEELLRSWGFRIAGRSERANRKKPAIDYRVLWIDA